MTRVALTSDTHLSRARPWLPAGNGLRAGCIGLHAPLAGQGLPYPQTHGD